MQSSNIPFAAREGERFAGLGDSGNAVNQAGNLLEYYVAEGPYQNVEYKIINLL